MSLNGMKLINFMVKPLSYPESAGIMDIYSLCRSNLVNYHITLEMRESFFQKLLSKLSSKG